MAIAIDTGNIKTVSTLDALWALFKSQPKSVRKAFANRLNESMKAEREAKVKMTEKEFYDKLDRSIESSRNGETIAMMDGETTDQFIDRLLCTK